MDIISVNFETGAIVDNLDELERIQREKHAEYKKPEVQQIVSRKIEKDDFIMVYTHNKTRAEMAKELGISENMVNYYVNRYVPDSLKKRTPKVSKEKISDTAGGKMIQDYQKIMKIKSIVEPAKIINNDPLTIRGTTDEISDALNKLNSDDSGTDTDVGTTVDEITLTDVLLHELEKAEPVIIPQIPANEPELAVPVAYIDPEWREVSVNVALDHRASLDIDVQCIDNILDCDIDAVSDMITFRIREALKQIQADFQEQSDKITEALGKTKVVIWGMD